MARLGAMNAFVETDQQLGRTVLAVLRRLLLADLAEVPHVEPPVGAAGGQDGLVVGRPLDLLGRAATRVQLLQRNASLSIRLLDWSNSKTRRFLIILLCEACRSKTRCVKLNNGLLK